MVENCILPARKNLIPQIELRKKNLKVSTESISFFDDQNKFLSKKRITDIAKNSLSRSRFSSFLRLFANYTQASCILETGTSLGINTCYLAESNANSVISIEAQKELCHLAFKTVSNTKKQEKISLVNGWLDQHFTSLITTFQPDYVFLDADHRGETLLKQIDIIHQESKNKKVVIIHDIYWSRDMYRAWQKIKSNPNIPITIDLFEAGILVYHIQTPKQHFTIKMP